MPSGLTHLYFLIHWVYYGFILTLLPCLTLCVVFQKFGQAYYNLSDEIYLPQNFGSLKSMEGLPLTTLEQNPSDMAGETVIDCRPSLLPVSIPLCHLSPETISEARSCGEYQPLEESGGSIMHMDTNEISINRIVGFAWNDCGTDVEDELPSPRTSPVTTRTQAVASGGPVDPYGRGENFDLDLAKVFCDVSVLPALVTPVVDIDLNTRESAVDYAPPMVPDAESTRGEVPEASGRSWIPEFVPPPVAEASVDGSLMELLQETGIKPTSPLPLSPMPVDTSMSTAAPTPQRDTVELRSTSPVLSAGHTDTGPDLSREGPFDACDADLDAGQSPIVMNSMAGCQYRMTSYEDRVYHSDSDLDPSYGIHMHDPRVIKYMGAPESARLMGRTPEHWLHHMGRDLYTFFTYCFIGVILFPNCLFSEFPE